MIIDAHLHVWDRARARYDWLGPHLPEVNRDIDFAEIRSTLEALGVGAVVLVQSADNAADTSNMLRVAAEEPLVRGIVGWVAVEDPTVAARQLDAVIGDSRIVGIRNLIHDRPDPDWALRPEFGEGLALLEAHDLPFDFVTADPMALSRLERVAAERPLGRFVLDHLGKPPINGSAADHASWVRKLRAVASRPNVVAKVSGLYSAAGPESSWTQEGIERVVDVAVDVFGPDRLMYGGDWPMSLRAGGYERVFRGLQQAVSDWPVEAAQDFWWRTASRTYGLNVKAVDAGEREKA